MWSASALLSLRCPSLLYWSFTPHAGQCVMPMACALASTCFLNCLCSRVLVLLTAAHCCSLLLVFLVGVRWWRVAASARRAPPPSNTTPCSSSFFPSSSAFLPSFLSLFWYGGCRVVRAQPCEHARSTTAAYCVRVRVHLMRRVLLLPQTHCSLLTITMFTIEH
nr:MAG TPA: hypothetical protein [Caudoviricetes sp.]